MINPGNANNSAFIRGGNWNNGAIAGAFTLNLNNAPTDTNTNIGFRVARSFTLRHPLLRMAAWMAADYGRSQRAKEDLQFAMSKPFKRLNMTVWGGYLLLGGFPPRALFEEGRWIN